MEPVKLSIGARPLSMLLAALLLLLPRAPPLLASLKSSLLLPPEALPATSWLRDEVAAACSC